MRHTRMQSYREGQGPKDAASEPAVLSMVTATDHRECFEAGMKDVVGEPSTHGCSAIHAMLCCAAKPFTLETLREKIEKWMPAAL